MEFGESLPPIAVLGPYRGGEARAQRVADTHGCGGCGDGHGSVYCIFTLFIYYIYNYIRD